MTHLHSVIALSLLAATAARADVTVFDNEEDFLAAAPPVVTETFDDLPDMQVPLVLEVDNLEFSTRGTWQVPGACSIERSLGASSIARRHITFLAPGGAPGAVHAFGFRLTTIVISPPADYSIVVVTLDGELTANVINDTVNGSPAYRGFVSTSPILRVVVNALGVSQFNYCFDDISHSAILGSTE